MRLGKTELEVNATAFGALPIQRDSVEVAVKILRKAYDAGINYFDTARVYSDSEEKIGEALAGERHHIFLATKLARFTVDAFWEDLNTSLQKLRTDYIDVYQFHNPSFCPKPGDGSGLYEAMLEAKAQGKIRFIGISNHRLAVAEEAVRSGLYDTLQFPFSYLSIDKDIALAELCKQNDVGFVAMKALSGGLITNARAAFAWMRQRGYVLPIWGIQHESELDEFISYMKKPPELDEDLQAVIDHDRKELIGEFCRGCGYCMPCPQGIPINNAARMIQMIRRSPSQNWLSPEWQKQMLRIDNCIECGQCRRKCPYGLDTPKLLKENLADYKNILSGKVTV
jgi:predicted aldo/keto reductase-like oxidoreductase